MELPLIEARGVSFAYPQRDQLILRGVDLAARPGKIIAILGPSGSGKTTLLRLLARLQDPLTGEIQWAPGLRIGFVFQRDALLPWRRVSGNLCYPLEARRVPRSERYLRAREAHACVRLPESTWNRFPDELSGGERRRLSIAVNLVRQTDVLLMDEPTSQLDEPNRWHLQGLIQALLVEGSAGRQVQAVIVVTHDLDEAITLADSIYTLDAAGLGEAIPVALPRPRVPEMRSDRGFCEIRTTLLERLRHAEGGER